MSATARVDPDFRSEPSTTDAHRTARFGNPPRRPLLIGLLGSLMLLVGGFGAGGVLVRDPLMTNSVIGFWRYGHGHDIAAFLMYGGRRAAAVGLDHVGARRPRAPGRRPGRAHQRGGVDRAAAAGAAAVHPRHLQLPRPGRPAAARLRPLRGRAGRDAGDPHRQRPLLLAGHARPVRAAVHHHRQDRRLAGRQQHHRGRAADAARPAARARAAGLGAARAHPPPRRARAGGAVGGGRQPDDGHQHDRRRPQRPAGGRVAGRGRPARAARASTRPGSRSSPWRWRSRRAPGSRCRSWCWCGPRTCPARAGSASPRRRRRASACSRSSSPPCTLLAGVEPGLAARAQRPLDDRQLDVDPDGDRSDRRVVRLAVRRVAAAVHQHLPRDRRRRCCCGSPCGSGGRRATAARTRSAARASCCSPPRSCPPPRSRGTSAGAWRSWRWPRGRCAGCSTWSSCRPCWSIVYYPNGEDAPLQLGLPCGVPGGGRARSLVAGAARPAPARRGRPRARAATRQPAEHADRRGATVAPETSRARPPVRAVAPSRAPAEPVSGARAGRRGIHDARRCAAPTPTCRALNARHGRTYFLATRLLPRARRPAVHALYGFARYADEIVDDLDDDRAPAAKAARLDALADAARHRARRRPGRPPGAGRAGRHRPPVRHRPRPLRPTSSPPCAWTPRSPTTRRSPSSTATSTARPR